MDKELLKKMADPNERHWFDKLINHHMEETAFLRSTIAQLLKVYDKEERQIGFELHDKLAEF